MNVSEPSSEKGTNPIAPELLRYAKQIRVPGIGVAGQQRIAASRVVVIGCGALGSVIANLLARAGVGELIILDRDFVELDNLQRQVIYGEADLGMPKAKVAERRLRAVNSTIHIEGRIEDVEHRNIESHLLAPRPANVVVDGTDNFEIRFLINDTCVKHGLPWVYGGCLGAEGQVLNILPGQSGCLNCLMPDGPPPPGVTATCDTGGILSTVINVVAAIQVNEVLKILSGNLEQVNNKLQIIDLWNNRTHSMDVSALRDMSECPTCHRREFSWLNGQRGSHSVVLCGRNAVQVSYPDRSAINLEELANRLEPLGKVSTNEFLVRLHVGDYLLSIFQDGRAIINGTDDIATAKKIYAQYIGA